MMSDLIQCTLPCGCIDQQQENGSWIKAAICDEHSVQVNSTSIPTFNEEIPSDIRVGSIWKYTHNLKLKSTYCIINYYQQTMTDSFGKLYVGFLNGNRLFDDYILVSRLEYPYNIPQSAIIQIINRIKKFISCKFEFVANSLIEMHQQDIDDMYRCFDNFGFYESMKKDIIVKDWVVEEDPPF